MADVTAETGAYGQGYHFLARRLHSLSGIIPVGVFLCVHLSVNASIVAGPKAFQFAVDQIHNPLSWAYSRWWRCSSSSYPSLSMPCWG